MEMDHPSRSVPAPEHWQGHSFAAGVGAAPPEDGDGGWLVSFVDILMLLLTLFVLLLAISHLHRQQAAPAPVATARNTTQSAPHRAVPVKPAPAPAHARTATVHPGAAKAAVEVAATAPAQSAAPASPAPAPLVASTAPTRLPPALTAAVVTPAETPAAEKPVAPGELPAPGRPLAKAPGPAKAAHTASAPHGRAKPGAATPVKSAPAPAKAAVPAKPAFSVPADISKQVEVVASASKVNLVVKDDVLFAPGSARLRPTGRTVLSHIAALLGRDAYPVSVRGYTDNTPIHTARFPSNWELSTTRATVVTRFLIGRGIASDRLSAVGYGATRPRASNATAAGRARNRRVSLVVHLHGSAHPTAPAPAHAPERH
ncbi:MAG TPA: OmpA family protein [Gammaproteobacteria bacterium]|nr:OmpA family protein [Gammaproteobacteria bacterium]